MRTKVKKIIYPILSYKLTGLLFEVHNHLDRYRNEKQYADYFEELLKRERSNYKRKSAITFLV